MTVAELRDYIIIIVGGWLILNEIRNITRVMLGLKRD